MYGVTALFSVFAYVWLIIILIVWTPDVVTITEAVITLLCFPVLVMLAYAADKGYFNFSGAKGFTASHLVMIEGHHEAITGVDAA